MNIDQIILPSTVKEIDKEAFMYCQISEINLSNGLEAIDDSAFAYCDKLKSLLLPDSVSMLGTKVFLQLVQI
ncbi:MAG: leucine-rich repeat domain-containing protein [Bacilli bacterium]|nr:leucine-rich repeat domain-containing protein [Bacilli bacterium]HHU24454.1 leucine-rich repeat domain-containing protein [Acholeplasmataceae bacterium]